jgi:CDP-diacylglycerol--serine O-phosphatidyltransferase
MVTSGVVPGYVMFFLLSNSQHEISALHVALSWIYYRWVLVTVWLYLISIRVRRIHSLVYNACQCTVYFKLPLVLKYSDSLIA